MIGPNSQMRTGKHAELRAHFSRFPGRNSKGNARIVTQVSGSRVLLLSLFPAVPWYK